MFKSTKSAIALVSNSISIQLQQQLKLQATKQAVLREQYAVEGAIYTLACNAKLEASYVALDTAVQNSALTEASLTNLRAKYPQA